MIDENKLKKLYCGVFHEIRSSAIADVNTAQAFSFFPDRRLPWGIVIDIQISKRARKQIFSLAHFLERRGYTSSSSVYDETINSIYESICRIAASATIINQTNLHKKDNRSLFDLHIGAIEDFMTSCFNDLKSKLNENDKNRIVLLPGSKIKATDNYLFDALNILILKREDSQTWDSVMKSYGVIEPWWDITAAKFKNDKSDPFGKFAFSSWIVYFKCGPIEEIMQEFKYSVCILITLLVAITEKQKSIYVHSSSSDTNQYSAVFSQNQGSMYKGAGFALPKLSEELNIDDNIDAIRDWINGLDACNPDQKSRIKKACYYFFKGLSASGDDEFVWYFVALDALFGQRKGVEELIVAGVTKAIDTPMIETNIRRLYKLRCELIHGGIRSIHEWNKISEYGKEFNIDPTFNLHKIAIECLMKSPLLDLQPHENA